MTKRAPKSNVVQMSQGKSRGPSKADRLRLAQKKVSCALASTGEDRCALAREALTISEDCVDAYLLLAEDLKDTRQRIELYRKAVDAGSRALGRNWETKYEGLFWSAHETRPLMHAMARLAMDLQWEDEFTEALQLYMRLMQMNPNDNQGIRYQLAGCLYETGRHPELELLFETFIDDPSAALLYTKALHLFRKRRSVQAVAALKDAFAENIFVPIYLSDVVEMPDDAPASIGFGDQSEAIAYVLDHGYLWWDTDGATKWMSDTLAAPLRKTIDNRELAEAVIKSLHGFDD